MSFGEQIYECIQDLEEEYGHGSFDLIYNEFGVNLDKIELKGKIAGLKADGLIYEPMQGVYRIVKKEA